MTIRILAATFGAAAGLAMFAAGGPPALADHHIGVKVTPLGSHDGEFCQLDRALIFEDPDGTRVLYDPGRTVAGPDDPRLGKIDVILISHMHGDHFGDRHIGAAKQGPCSDLAFPVAATPNSNLLDIAKAKGAKVVAGSEMPGFLAPKLAAMGGNKDDVMLARFGAEQQVGGVKITTVPAVHSNGLSGAFIGGDLGKMLSDSGLNAYVGPPTGYVLTFSNGLVAWLSGDTGVTAEQETVVNRQYGAKLAVLNIGGTFTTGPVEAAFVVNELVKPASVIASHANEPATEGGKVKAGTKTETFMKTATMPVHVPLSGKTMTFGKDGTCTDGC